MAHIVKCAICGQEFNRDKIQAVKHSARRYSHFTCEPDGEKVGMPEVDKDLFDLQEYINILFNGKQNQAKINKSLKKFIDENGYSYSGILKTLKYFYEVKGNSIEKANGGISIVPYVYQDAYNYYYSLFMAQQGTLNKELVIKEKEITIRPPHMLGTKHKLMKLGEEDE